MKRAIYITGHKNPDTDSIVAAISYANLKQSLGENAIACRLGPINNETTFLLDYFHYESIPLISDAYPRIYDVEYDPALIVEKNQMISEAISLMSANGQKVIGVLDNEKLVGIITSSDITESLVDDSNKHHLLLSKTPLENFEKILKGKLAYKPENNINNGEIFIASTSSLDKQLESLNNKIVITSSNESTQLRAINNAGVIIATNTNKPYESVLKKAMENNCGYLVTDYDMYKTAQLINQAIPVELIMADKIISFDFDEYLETVKDTIKNYRYRSYPVLDYQKHLIGFISRYHLLNYNSRQMILVDHNEPDQSIQGIEKAEILEIIDHHRLGGIRTDMPAYFRNELVGSCNTIILGLYREKNIEIPKDIAGLMLGAIISDTMNFHSVTCTNKDIEAAEYLAQLTEINREEFGEKVLQASIKSDYTNPTQLVYNDLKVFEMEDAHVAIGQVNVRDVDLVNKFEEDLSRYLEEFMEKNRYEIAIMIFSMIDSSGCYLIYKDKIGVVRNSFQDYLVKKDGKDFLKGIISRKKQIVPLLSKSLRKV